MCIRCVRGGFTGIVLALAMLTPAVMALAEEHLKPFELASETVAEFASVVAQVDQALAAAGFELAGRYQPYEGAEVLIVTSDYLRTLVGQEPNVAFLVGMRVSITQTDSGIQVAYPNPDYFAHAYRIEGDLAPVSKALGEALGRVESFGAKGLTARQLQRYHYTFGMEYFDDELELAQFPSHKAALEQVAAGLEAGRGGVTQVYRIDIPRVRISVFGVAMNEGMSSDRSVMEVVDYQQRRHTAHLPYEMVVMDGVVKALAPRFRIAINFPDLKMTGEHGFTRLMSTPDAINKALTLAAGGEWVDRSLQQLGFGN